MCEACSGYVINFVIYTGKSTALLGPESVGMTGQTVTTLLQNMHFMNYVVYMDNWFTNIVLAVYLLSVGIYIVSTIRVNRKGACFFLLSHTR